MLLKAKLINTMINNQVYQGLSLPVTRWSKLYHFTDQLIFASV